MKFLRRASQFFVLVVIVAPLALIVGGAYDARWRLPDLKPWHRLTLDDVRAADLKNDFTLAQYLVREDRVFERVRVFESTLDAADRTPVNRYNPGSLSSPASAGRDWNRTFEVEPEQIRAGALLIHGLTDSPYSMRAVADVLRDQGVYALALRMPGHGTAPSELRDVTWADWMAAVRLGVRHVRSRIPANAPLILVGYSNGGALALKYTIEAIEHQDEPMPAKLILLSPMVGVSPVARLAWWISRLASIPYFEKANWLDVLPEYNPFKYNSFPTNAAFQTDSLTRSLQDDLTRAADRGELERLPPMLSFQSIVDATVSTPAVVHRLYDQLPANGSELVLFDVNHRSGIDVFVQPSDRMLMSGYLGGERQRYRRVLVTNSSPQTFAVDAATIEPAATIATRRPLGLTWPPQVFSLTHVAIPFDVTDPLYGIDEAGGMAGLLPIGRLSPRGERAVLTVGTDSLMRLSSNPFFPFMAQRIRDWVTLPPSP